MQAGMLSHRSLHARALRLRESVIARLLLTLILALSAVGTFQYFIVGNRVQADLIREHAAVHAADARSLELRAAAAQNNRYERPLSEVTEVLAAIAERSDTLDVAVLDLDGSVLASPTAGQVGVVRTDPLLRKAARSREPVEGEAAGERNAYITPMRLLGRRVLFAEYRSSDALKAGVASFRDSLGLFVLLSLLIALPLFYVLGGRSVGVLYRAALQGARRDGSPRRDGLTDRDNHRAFQDELSRAVGEATRYDSDVTLALLDIDDFKFENDRHGHQHGDRLLCELAELLREQRAGDRAFRLGGDEFAVLLNHTRECDADVPLERIRVAVERRLSGVTTSIGFSAARPEDREPSTLWGRADAALLEAKRRGGNAAVASTEVADSVPVVTIEKVRAVRSLIDSGAVDVAFQPIWDLGGTRVLGFEALARPRSSELSGPGEAFEIADSIGRGHELDAVCRRATLRAAGELPEGALLFLNVSPQTLEHDTLAGDSLLLAVRGAG